MYCFSKSAWHLSVLLSPITCQSPFPCNQMFRFKPDACSIWSLIYVLGVVILIFLLVPAYTIMKSFILSFIWTCIVDDLLAIIASLFSAPFASLYKSYNTWLILILLFTGTNSNCTNERCKYLKLSCNGADSNACTHISSKQWP